MMLTRRTFFGLSLAGLFAPMLTRLGKPQRTEVCRFPRYTTNYRHAEHEIADTGFKVYEIERQINVNGREGPWVRISRNAEKLEQKARAVSVEIEQRMRLWEASAQINEQPMALYTDAARA